MYHHHASCLVELEFRVGIPYWILPSCCGRRLGYGLWNYRVNITALGASQHLTPDRYDYATGTISPDVQDQAQQTLQNISTVLAEAGSCMDEVVRVNYILPNNADFEKTWPVLRQWFGESRPAATMIQAKLMNEEMKIEIEVTAKKGSANSNLS